VYSVIGHEGAVITNPALLMGIAYAATASISAETLRAIGIEVHHVKIVVAFSIHENQAVSSNTVFTVAQPNNLLCSEASYAFQDDEIIPGSLVLLKFNLTHSIPSTRCCW
jgi:hypothetical protein